MEQRQLTGKWYLKKTFWGKYKVMVEVKSMEWSDPSYGNGGGSYLPERTFYDVARESDLIELGINCKSSKKQSAPCAQYKAGEYPVHGC